MKRQIADRLFLCGLVLIDLGTAAFEAGTLRHAMMVVGGQPAVALATALTILTLVAAADTVINDVLPDRFCFTLGWRWRQRLWLLLAVLVAVQAFVVVNLGSGYWIAGGYALVCARAAAVSFLDLHYEHEIFRRDRRSTDFGDLHA